MAGAIDSPNSASSRMARVRQRDTAAEMALRRELHRHNLRYRVNYTVLEHPRRVADVAFPGLKVAIFVDGCFWHGCPQHGTWPKSNSQFWLAKIKANQARDADTNARLLGMGWHVLRVWEHESPVEAACRVEDLVRALKASNQENKK